jgi:hypothetical protein
MHWHGGEEGET